MEFNISNIAFSRKDIERKIKLPTKPTPELAEFLGILAGDGYVSFKSKDENLITVTGDSRLDREYLLEYVKPLIFRLFNADAKVQFCKNQNTMHLRIRSKVILSFLDEIGYYKNKRDISIPYAIESENLSKYFIMGLADTDFSLMVYDNRKKKPAYPIIAIGSISKNLVEFISKTLIDLGFLVSIEKNAQLDKRTNKTYFFDKVKLSGRKNLERWMKIISFRNKRHLDKYYNYWGFEKI